MIIYQSVLFHSTDPSCSYERIYSSTSFEPTTYDATAYAVTSSTCEQSVRHTTFASQHLHGQPKQGMFSRRL